MYVCKSLATLALNLVTLRLTCGITTGRYAYSSELCDIRADRSLNVCIQTANNIPGIEKQSQDPLMVK